jgi:TonB family protein
VERVAVVPPDVDPTARVFGLTELSLVIDAGGHPKDIQVAHSLSEPYDRAAIDAVMRTQFAPGTVEERPVPVRVTIRVFFGRGNLPSYPHILSGSQRSFGNAQRPSDLLNSAVDHPPVAVVTAMPEFSEQARAAKYQGVVVLSMLVNEEGLPEDVQIIRHLEMGLDDKAIEAARKYRFKPAMKAGQPVPYRVTVEMNFRLY